MSVQWYVIDKRSGRIVNGHLTTRPGPPDLSGWLNAEHLEVTTTPTQEQLNGYRYYTERP